MKLTLKKEITVVTPMASTANVPSLAGNTVASETVAQGLVQDALSEAKTETNEVSGEAIEAPLVGIFYTGELHGAPVAEGTQVKKGDVLCTIEAMKMMNEVKAPRDGVIVKIGAKDGDLVEYQQMLFLLS
ncbi:MAG: acetyl-CoA carboxylase, biotin carboxyl carrier protein [Lachnospiraceae bacterium]|nr:acetyl-CoA carboxylase, biotin carboxyl carrier protein [Lachnospiraceae bacterium]